MLFFWAFYLSKNPNVDIYNDEMIYIDNVKTCFLSSNCEVMGAWSNSAFPSQE